LTILFLVGFHRTQTDDNRPNRNRNHNTLTEFGMVFRDTIVPNRIILRVICKVTTIIFLIIDALENFRVVRNTKGAIVAILLNGFLDILQIIAACCCAASFSHCDEDKSDDDHSMHHC